MPTCPYCATEWHGSHDCAGVWQRKPAKPPMPEYDEGWEMRGDAIKLWLDLFRRQGDLDDHMMFGLHIAEKALEATRTVQR